MMFWILTLNLHPFQKSQFYFLSSVFTQRFWEIFRTLNATVAYHVSVWDVAKIHCIHILSVNALSRFHYNVSFCFEIFCTNSCFLKLYLSPYCWKPFKLREELISRETVTKVQIKHILNRWMQFQNIAYSWELQQIRYLLHVRKITEKPPSILLIFIYPLCFTLFRMHRSNRPEVFFKKCVPRSFAKFTEKHLCQRLFFSKVAGPWRATLLNKRLWQAFSCEFCEISNNTFFTKHLL